MTGKKSISRKKLALAVASGVMLGISGTSFAEDEIITLELKEQRAGQMLTELGEKAGVQIMLDHKVSKELVLPSISGQYRLEDALGAILQGTGLIYEFASDNLIVIKTEVEENDKGVEKEVKEVDEEIVVTGSRLIQDPGKQTKQMTVFSREEIERSGINRLDEFLQRLPQNVNAPNNVGGGFVGDGVGRRDFGLGNNVFAGSGINLRGLGSQYTLVLIDGRRPPAGGQFGGITDISNIPIDRVERIEILFDGAASIYGADAIGGVVNIITNRKYEGTNIALTIDNTADGGGKRYNFNIGRSFSWDSGSLTGSFNYQTQQAIDGAERDLQLVESRDFSLPPSLPGTVGGFPDGALLPGVDRQAVMWVRDVDGDGRYDTESLDERITGGVRFDTVDFRGRPTMGTVSRENPVLPVWANQPNDPDLLDNLAANRPQDNGYIPVRVLQVPESNGEVLSLYDVDLSDYQAIPGNEGVYAESAYEPRSGQSLSPEDETYSLGLALDQELTESLSLSLSANYSKTEKRNNTRGGAEEFTVQGTSLTNPFEAQIQYVWANSFPQQYQESQIDSYSLAGDLNWQMNDDWEVVFGWGLGETDQSSDSFNQLYRGFETPPGSISVNNLLDGRYRDENFDPVPIEGVVFHDPLLGFDTVEELLAVVVNPLIHTENNSYSRDMDINIRGVVAQLPGGDVRANITLSHQRTRNEILNDNVTFSVAGNQVLDNVGDGLSFIGGVYRDEYAETTNAFGFEVAAPLVGQDNAIPLVQEFLVSASARIEDYSTVEDNGELWSLGFNWQLTDSMAIRVNRDRGVRIPGAARFARPLESDSRRTRLFADETQENFIGWQDYFGLSGGARHLDPEISNNVKVGFIFTPTFLAGLRAELSFTEQEVEDQIGVPGVARFLTPEILADLQINPQPTMFIATQEFVDEFIARDDYIGDVPTVGALVRDERVYNVGATRQQGADLELRYNSSSQWGNWFVTWRHQYLRKSEILQSGICAAGDCISDVETSLFGLPEAFNQFVDIVGTVDKAEFNFKSQVYNALPEHRSSLEFFWEHRGFGLSLRTDYTTDTHLIVVDYDPFSDAENRREITTRPTRSLDMTLSYQFADGLFAAPDWLDSTRVSLTINDLWRREQQVTQRYISQEFTTGRDEFAPVNGYAIDPRGRSFSLNITSSF